MNKILTLEQLQNMSIDEITIAYQNGYILSENTELYDNTKFPTSVPISTSTVLPTALANSQIAVDNYEPQQHTVSLQATNHYTQSDILVISAAIGISVVILGSLTYYLIQREEKRIIKEIKDTIVGSIVRVPTIIEELIPLARRLIAKLPIKSES